MRGLARSRHAHNGRIGRATAVNLAIATRGAAGVRSEPFRRRGCQKRQQSSSRTRGGACVTCRNHDLAPYNGARPVRVPGGREHALCPGRVPTSVGIASIGPGHGRVRAAPDRRDSAPSLRTALRRCLTSHGLDARSAQRIVSGTDPCPVSHIPTTTPRPHVPLLCRPPTPPRDDRSLLPRPHTASPRVPSGPRITPPPPPNRGAMQTHAEARVDILYDHQNSKQPGSTQAQNKHTCRTQRLSDKGSSNAPKLRPLRYRRAPCETSSLTDTIRTKLSETKSARRLSDRMRRVSAQTRAPLVARQLGLRAYRHVDHGCGSLHLTDDSKQHGRCMWLRGCHWPAGAGTPCPTTLSWRRRSRRWNRYAACSPSAAVVSSSAEQVGEQSYGVPTHLPTPPRPPPAPSANTTPAPIGPTATHPSTPDPPAPPPRQKAHHRHQAVRSALSAPAATPAHHPLRSPPRDTRICRSGRRIDQHSISGTGLLEDRSPTPPRHVPPSPTPTAPKSHPCPPNPPHPHPQKFVESLLRSR